MKNIFLLTHSSVRFSFLERGIVFKKESRCTVYESGEAIDKNTDYCTEEDLLPTKEFLLAHKKECSYIMNSLATLKDKVEAYSCAHSFSAEIPIVEKEIQKKKEIDFSKFSSFSDHFSVFKKDDLRVFSLDDWEAKGYDLSEEVLEDGVKNIFLKKGKSSIKIFSIDENIVTTTYLLENGEEIDIYQVGSIEFFDSKGNSYSLYSSDSSDNKIESLLGNDALLSLSKKERDSFLRSLSSSDNSSLRKESVIKNNTDGSISQDVITRTSGETVKDITTKAQIDSVANTVTVFQDGKQITLPVIYDERSGNPFINSRGIDISVSLEEEILKKFK